MSRIKLVAIGGLQGAGKSIFADYLTLELGPGWLWQSTSDVLIRFLAQRLGIDELDIRSDKQKYRKQLQELGDEYNRVGPAYVAQIALITDGAEEGIVFESVRRKMEIDYLKARGALFVLVEADRETREKRRGGLVGEDHPTEFEAYEELKNLEHIVLIDNNGTEEDLAKQAVKLAGIIKQLSL